MVRHRVRSGVTGSVAMEVAGLPFHPTHMQVIQKLLEVTKVPLRAYITSMWSASRMATPGSRGSRGPGFFLQQP